MKYSMEYTIYIERRIKEIEDILSKSSSIFEYEFSESVSFNLSNCFAIGELKVLKRLDKREFPKTKV